MSGIERTARVGVLQLIVPDGPVWWSDGVPALLGLPAGTAPGWTALRAAFGESGVTSLCAAVATARRAQQELDIDLPLAAGQVPPAWMRICGRVAIAAGLVEANAIIQDVSERRQIATLINQATSAERQRLLCRELFRIVQEALTNAPRHAGCHRIRIDLSIGIDLRTMRYRAARPGTTAGVAPAAAGGSCVSLSVPRTI